MIDTSKLLNGDRRTLAKAITLIESSREEDQSQAQELLKAILPKSGKSFRIGITGVPGVGKSTFIEAFGQLLIQNNYKVAVLAIDPSSPVSGGSILGDKTRMDKLSQSELSFIRPSPSRCFLGGVAQKTRESILLCEAAGYDFILVETVGVGQSEYEVADMVDFFMILMLPGAGDELQGIKKGILELADAIIINKADGENLTSAKVAKSHYENALHLLDRGDKNTIVEICSSLSGDKLDFILKFILDYKNKNIQKNFHRNDQNLLWFEKLIDEMIKIKCASDPNLKKLKFKLQDQIKKNQTLPLDAAQTFIDEIF